MKIKPEDIPPEGLDATFTENEGPMNERLGGETTLTGIHFTEPIQVHVHLTRSGATVVVNSRFEAKAKAICVRCLEAFSLTLSAHYPISLKPKPKSPPAEEVELSRQDLETDFYEGEEIDLTPVVQDQVLLAIPQKIVCREDCRGLCQGCGKNLNRETCQCTVKEIDPRLEVLKNFRVH